MDRSSPLQLLFPLADVLQFNLYLCKEPGNVNSVRGYVNMALPLNDKMNLPFKALVVASSVRDNEAYVVVEIMGNLMALVAYDSHMKECTLILLDRADLEGENLSFIGKYQTINNLSVSEAMTRLAKATRGIWIKAEGVATWSRIDATESVVPSTNVVAPKALRANHSSRAS